MIGLAKRKKILVRLRPDDRVIILGGGTAIEQLQAEHERAMREWRKSCRGWRYQHHLRSQSYMAGYSRVLI